MTTFELILAYPLTALAVFLAAVAVLWLCLAVGIWAAWVLGWFDWPRHRRGWWSEVARPRLAQQWREVSKLWGGESTWPTGNPWNSDQVGHGRADDSLRPSTSNGRSAVHTTTTPYARDEKAGPRPRSAHHFTDHTPRAGAR